MDGLETRGTLDIVDWAHFQSHFEDGTIDLSYQTLKVLPSDLETAPIDGFPECEILRLDANFLQELPTHILTLFPNIRGLSLYLNNMKTITFPQIIFRQLEWLDMSRNKLETVPELGMVAPNLKRLNLAFNDIKDLSGLTGLEKLEILSLSFNKLKFKTIQQIPDLPRLKSIYMCELRTRPETDEPDRVMELLLERCPQLEYVAMWPNPSEIPSGIAIQSFQMPSDPKITI